MFVWKSLHSAFSLLMNIFSRFTIQDWNSFFFFPVILKKCHFIVFWILSFLLKVRPQFYCRSFEDNVSIFSSCFQVFSLLSSNLSRRHLKVTFFACLLLRFHWFSGILGLGSFIRLEEFSVIRSSNFVSLTFPLLSLWDSSSQDIKRFDSVSHVFHTLFYAILVLSLLQFKCFSVDVLSNPLILFSPVSRFFLYSYSGFFNIVYCILL